MHNLINKFEAEVSQTEDAGLVAIEYVVMAAVLIAGLGVLAWTGAFTALTDRAHGDHRRHHLSLVLGRIEGEAPASPFALSLSLSLSTETS